MSKGDIHYSEKQDPNEKNVNYLVISFAGDKPYIWGTYPNQPEDIAPTNSNLILEKKVAFKFFNFVKYP